MGVDHRESGPLRETVLSPRLVVLTLGGDRIDTGWGVNCVAFAGTTGTLLVDPMMAPAHARLVQAALERRAFPAVRQVVLTHHHSDHALGAAWFAARGAEVLAQRRCAEAMAAQHPSMVAARRRARDPGVRALFEEVEVRAPSGVFDEARALDLGGERVEVRHLGRGHTAGDAVVVFPSERAAACGDLVFAGYHYNYEEAEVSALQERLLELAAFPGVERFVPGHGLVGGRELVETQARYHAEVERLVRAGGRRKEIEARFPGYELREVIGTAVDVFGGG
jgi:glyoxylase-like metal-dependent hydrolase (beta-lactamase superfamily II)